MNRTIVIAAAFLVATSTASLISAQTRPATPATAPARPATPQTTPPPTSVAAPVAVPATKIAFVDTSVFSDEKSGIKRYINAAKSVEAEFTPKQTELNNLQTRMSTLADEISKLGTAPVVSQDTITAKRSEGERLQRDYKYKKEQADADFQKRYAEVITPVSNEIGKALDQYAIQHGITLVLDISKLLPAILTANPASDITTAFIADYNSTHP